MNFFKSVILVLVLSLPLTSNAAGGGSYGFNVAISTPFLTQYGLNYVNTSKNFSAEIAHSALTLSSLDFVISGQSNTLILRWHPFNGSFFLGAGVGQKIVSSEFNQAISATDSQTKLEITATTLTPTLGWMWGISDGGFFGGFDVGYQTHLSTKSNTTSTVDSSIKVTADEIEKLGKLGFPVITLLKIGYLF